MVVSTRRRGALVRRLWAALVLSGVAGLAAGRAVAATDALVIGDSLGVGVSLASGVKRLAKNSVAIRGGGILSQIQQAPPDSTVFMSLGTNDAVGRIDGLDGDIGRIVAAAKSAGVKLVWLGPPCVTKDWDANAARLDGIIRARVAGTGVTYVGMREGALCGPGLRAKDGVHLTMRGYGMMWARARAAAGLGDGEVRVASAEPRAVRSSKDGRTTRDGRTTKEARAERRKDRRRERTEVAAAGAPAAREAAPERPQGLGDFLSSLFFRPTASAGD